MMKCPNCGSEKHRLQLALNFADSAQRVCMGCGCAWPEFVPTAIAMIVYAAPRFPHVKMSFTAVQRRHRPHQARRPRGLNSRQMLLRAAL
jgi:hypothetical protein